MENRLRGDKANKDIPSVCGDTSAENISREKNKKNTEEKISYNRLFCLCVCGADAVVGGKHTSAYCKHRRLFLPPA